MSALDFLFEGKPPPAVSSYGQTVSGLPQWLSDYSQGILSQAAAAGSAPLPIYGGPRIAPLTPDQQNAANLARSSTGEATGMIRGAAQQPGALSAAAPYMQAASQTFPQVAQSYMNPYIENVTNRAATLTNRALNEQLLPSLERTFGGAGGQDVRSSAYLREANRGTRDLAEGLQGQNLAALAQGWDTAGQQANADLSRQGILAQTAGQFAGADRSQTANLANALQTSQANDVGALNQVGQMVQGQQQKNLDTAYSDFLRQAGYPEEQISWMAGLANQLPTEKFTQTAGNAPGTTFQPSGISQLGSAATGVAGLLQAFKGLGGNQTTGAPIDPAAAVARGGLLRRRYYGGGILRYANAA